MAKNLYEIKIPSTQDHLTKAEKFLEDSFREHGVDDDLIADLAISATELINNAIIHGNKSDPEKSVLITVEFTADSLTISITDEGEGFIPSEIPDPIADENLLKETGRGIFIVRSLVDDLQFEICPEGGTRMVIIKKLAS